MHDGPYINGKPPEAVLKALTTLTKHAQEMKLMHVQFQNGPYMVIITAHPDVQHINMQIAEDIRDGKCLECGKIHTEEELAELKKDGNHKKFQLES